MEKLNNKEDFISGAQIPYNLDLAHMGKKDLVARTLNFLKREFSPFGLADEHKQNVSDVMEALQIIYEVTPSYMRTQINNNVISEVLREQPEVEAEVEKICIANTGLGHRALLAKEYSEAVTFYTKAVNANSMDPVVFVKRAKAYSQLGQYEEAISDCDTALSMQRTCHEAHNILGFVHFKLGNWDASVRECEIAVEADAKNMKYRKDCARAQRRYLDDLALNDPLKFRMFEALLAANSRFRSNNILDPNFDYRYEFGIDEETACGDHTVPPQIVFFIYG